VVLNFWASWCLACRSEHTALSSIASMYEGKNVHFYGVLYNDVAPNAQRYIRELGGQTYPTLIDPGSRTAIDYGLYGVPETFFIDRNGTVAHKHVGPVTEALLVEWIEKARAQPPEAS
jgi:cytochrome c biogenesis protein CcmG, thiol:disulfide interchange protein DsbE